MIVKKYDTNIIPLFTDRTVSVKKYVKTLKINNVKIKFLLKTFLNNK